MALFGKTTDTDVRKQATPTQLRAYERLTLLLERTTPEAIIGRMDDLMALSVVEVERQILQTIRLEFDHNITQQIYVSDELWRLIVNAKEQMIAFVIAITRQLPADISTADYAKALATAYHNNGDTPHEIALDSLKREVRTLL